MSPIAILAPYDKTGLEDLTLNLAELGFEIYSTSGTQKYLIEKTGLAIESISTLTGFPEILDGRVKTLHPMVHGGILARRDKPEHMAEIERSGIRGIDLVCANLYPFRETISRADVTEEMALENIDIGGPTMLRAAAKNYPWVLPVVDPDDYKAVIDALKLGLVHEDYRRALAAKAFQHVSAYDTMIAGFLRSERGGSARPSIPQQEREGMSALFPAQLTVGLEKVKETRYGENPHQKAAVYADPTPGRATGLVDADLLHGLDMSYLNYFDGDGAWRCALDYDGPTVVIVKHATPCGIASADNVAIAYERAYASDEISPFGGIIAVNREVTWDMTEAMKGKRYDIIVAPGYEALALERLKKRRDLRILQIPRAERPRELEYRSILGGVLVQTPDTMRGEDIEPKVMTKRAPTAKEMEQLRFAWTCVKHVKSNGVVIARDFATVGIGAGQPNRLWATQHAIEHAGDRAKGGVAASDAFFPFARGDAVEDACKAGVTAIIQPGGGNRDDEAVEVCDQYGVAMVFTGARAFRH